MSSIRLAIFCIDSRYLFCVELDNLLDAVWSEYNYMYFDSKCFEIDPPSYSLI